MGMFDDIGAAVAGGPGLAIGALTTLGTGYMNQRAQDKQNERNEANTWDMYNTSRSDAKRAHQDEAADLKAAGFNPLLTGMKGSGSQVQTGNPPEGKTIPYQSPNIIGDIATMQGLVNSTRSLDQTDQKLAIDAAAMATGKDKLKLEQQGTISGIIQNLTNKAQDSSKKLEQFQNKIYESLWKKNSNKKMRAPGRF